MFISRARPFGLRLVLTALALALGCALLPGSARATLTWSSTVVGPAQLSPKAAPASDVQVATDAAGDSLAVWLQIDPNNSQGVHQVAEAYRPAGGNFGQWSYISDDVGDAESLKVAMNASGEAIVTWNEDVESSGELSSVGEGTLPEGVDGEYAMVAPGGSFGPVSASAADIDGNSNGLELDDTQVGIDSAGDAVIAYIPANDASGSYPDGSVVAQLRPAGSGSVFGTGQVINGAFQTAATDQNTLEPTALSLAMNGAGAAVVAWDEANADQSGDFVDSAYLPAGANQAFSENEVSNEEAEEETTGPPAAALDTNGNALVVYEQIATESDTVAVEAASRTATAQYFSLPQPVGSFTTTDDDRPDSSWDGVGVPSAAFDGSGNAFAMWGGAAHSDLSTSADDYDAHSGDPLSVAYKPAGGSFASPVQVAGGPVGDAQLGVDSQGRQAIQWDSADSGGTVEATSRDTGSGAFSTPVTVTTPVDPNINGEDGSAPQLSMSAGGQAVGVWQVNDGSEDVVQADFGDQPSATAAPTAPGAPSPPTTSQPAPPPAPAAIPTAISAAAPFQRGRAIVLTATVSPGVTQVRWSIPGYPAAVGTVVNGQVQASVRLHPMGKTVTVSVTTISPIDQETSSRTFGLLAQPTDETTQTVQRELTVAPKEIAVGDAPTLLGDTACGQLTLYDGARETTGCMRPLNTVSDVPNSELGSIQTMASDFGLNASDPTAVAAALAQVDGYVAPSEVLLDNVWPVESAGGASIVSFPELGALTSSNAALIVGGLKFGGLASGFSLTLDPNTNDIPLGNLTKPNLPSIAGFPTVGDWNITLGDSDANITATVQLPRWLSFTGEQLQYPVSFTATPTQLSLNSLEIGPFDASLGPLQVSGLQLDYDQGTVTWTGTGTVCIVPDGCLSVEVKIRNGQFYYGGGSVELPAPGVPLFTGVYLNQFGFGVGLDPTRFQGNATITVLDLFSLHGTILAAFPSAREPFYLTHDEDGDDFPSDLYGQAFTEPTIGASGDVSIDLPVIGETSLASGYLLYEIPDYIAVGGNINLSVLDILSFTGSVAGRANFATKMYSMFVHAHACIDLAINLCADGAVAISHGPQDTGGVGGCVGLSILGVGVSVGGGILWKHPDDPDIWPIDGCKWTPFRLVVNVSPDLRSRDHALSVTDGRPTIVVKDGAPDPVLKIFGNGAAPLVRVTGPHGQSLDTSTTTGATFGPGAKIRILRYQGSAHSSAQGSTQDFTVIGLEDARPGVYTVTPMAGSVPFGTVMGATNPPDAKISAKLTGTGERRTLSYDIRRRPDQTVTFVDSDSGISHGTTIGHVSGGGRGSVHFTAVPGSRSRTIYAEFTLDGLSAERIAVAHYQPPSPTLGMPQHLKLTRHGTRVTVTFASVSDASGYAVSLTDPLTGDQLRAQGRSTRLVLTHVPADAGGTLAVVALDQRFMRESRPTTALATRLRMPASSFRALGHCQKIKATRRTRAHLECTGGPAATARSKHTTKSSSHT